MRGVIAVIVVFLAFALPENVNGQVASTDIVFDQKIIDFGEIEFGSGKFDVVYTFTNKGTENFQIRMVHTSCACTDPTWPKTIIPPGGKGAIKVTFDPEGLAGKISKDIEIFGNLTDVHKLVLSLNGNIKFQESQEPVIDNTFYPGQFGYLRLSQYSLFYGTFDNESIVEREFYIINDYNLPLEIKKVTSDADADYIKTTLSSTKVAAGDTIFVTVAIDGSKVKDYGELKNALVFETTDRFYAVKRVELFYNVKMAFKDSWWAQKRAPKAVFSETTIPLGNINTGSKIRKQIKLTNTGKRDLEILKVVTHCSCAVIEGYPTVIESGETATLNVEFDALFKKGPQSRTITIYTNDPQNYAVNITITADVEEYE